MHKLRKKVIALVLMAFMLVNSTEIGVQNVFAADTYGKNTGIHDIFFAKDNSKLEQFKERVLNGILYCDPAIDVSDLDISPNEIKCETAIGEVSGEWGASYIIRNHPFYSSAATMGNPTFTYKENGCVETVKYTYHQAWKTEFIEKVIASYDEVMSLIHEEDADFAKILKFHDWIVKNVSYKLSGSYADYAVGALANRSAVCAGYAKLYQFLLEQEGIENIYIDAKTESEQHAWNLVKYEGHWFHVDCTWDRGVGLNTNVNHWYFMMSDEEFNANGKHTDDWKRPEKKYPTGNVCRIENKFYEKNTDIATDEQIANNQITLTHQYSESSEYGSSRTEHWRTCDAGVVVRELHTGDSCDECGYDIKNDPEAGGGETENTSEGSGHTIIGILEATELPEQVSFEVPLYVVVAAVPGSDKVMAPAAGRYHIANGKGSKSNIGVIRMSIERVKGATWKTVEDTPKDAKEIRLSIGDYVIPALSGELEQKNVEIYNAQKDTKFTKQEKINNQIVYQQIAPNEKIDLDIAGIITNEKTRVSKAAAAQFRVKYVVSVLDEKKLPIGNVYVGNDEFLAFPQGTGIKNE